MEGYLDRYLRKRNFARTPEPAPGAQETLPDSAFVVHRHDARNLHFDLRLSTGARLVCFAVPKGFTYDAGVKHLAVHTEDHPIEYIGFEGIIPKGEYGAGSMTIWDAGTYGLVSDDLDAALAKGELKLTLSGRRLRGEWHLVRLNSEKDEWLIFKAKDRYQNKSWDALFGQIDLSDHPESGMPGLVKPMKPGAHAAPFSDPAWGFEIAFEGSRVFCFKDGADFSFRNSSGVVAGNELCVEQLAVLKDAIPTHAVFDGLLVAVDEQGLPSEKKLEQVLSGQTAKPELFFYMLDILYFEEYDVRKLTYSERKTLLSLVMKNNPRILYVDFLKGEGELFAREAMKAGVKNIIAKRLDSVYEQGESESWKLISLDDAAKSGDPVLGRIVPKRIEIRIANPDKIFFPEQNITKKELVSYYNEIGEYILPYLSKRIVHVNRFPDGIHGNSFYQKHLPDELPDFLEPVMIDGHGEGKPYFICNNLAGLLYLANLGSIDLHVWFSGTQHLDNPDWIAWDLDPKGAPFKDVVRLAKEIGKVLRGIELTPYVKTSGKTGLHILVPVIPVYTYDQTRMFAESVARIVASENNKIATVERNIGRRDNRVYIDFLQNRRGQTLVPPYSVRPVPAASVSMPLEWEELDGDLSIEMFTIKNARQRLEQKGDLFRKLFSGPKDLAHAIAKLESYYLKTREPGPDKSSSI